MASQFVHWGLLGSSGAPGVSLANFSHSSPAGVGDGERCSAISVGGIEPSIESPNGEELHLFLTGWQMFAANTFWPLGQGTWQSASGNRCLQWKNCVMSCSIETELPRAHLCQRKITLQCRPPSVLFQCVRADRSELRSGQCRERVTFMLEQTPCLPAEYGIERQARLLKKWFRCVLASAAPRCSSKRRHKWLSQGTWNAICAGAQLRKLMFAARRKARLVWLGSVFNCRRGCQTRWSWPGAERRGCKLGSRRHLRCFCWNSTGRLSEDGSRLTGRQSSGVCQKLPRQLQIVMSSGWCISLPRP